jgi:hypothetical protein
MAMNQKQRTQKSQMDSAQARRLKFINKASEVVDRVQTELEADNVAYSVGEVCRTIKAAIYEELISL